MINTYEFSQKQLELTAEFGKFVFEHPGIDDRIPDGACVYSQIAGEPEFNEYSRALAHERQREDGVTVVLVRVQGLAPRQGSRLIDPVIEPSPAVV